MKVKYVKHIGIWGQQHYAYLKKHSPTVINVMLIKGTFEQYLRDLDRDAEEMFSQLVNQFAESECITEELKSENQMLWTQRMNNIGDRVEKIVCNELIYC